MRTISKETVQNFILKRQGLLQPPEKAAEKASVLAVIQQMGALQIDTINVVARSPYLVLWSRLADYEPKWLDELLAEGRLFEYWSHEACFLPIEDFSYYRRFMLDDLKGWWSSRQWIQENAEIVQTILARIENEGALRSADFKAVEKRQGGWWNWKYEKIALENLFNTGDLMVKRRDNFQRVYDLRERVHPDWEDAKTPPLADVQRALLKKALGSLGIASLYWMVDYFRIPRQGINDQLRKLVQDDHLHPLRIDGFKEEFYIHSEHQDELDRLESGAEIPQVTTFLSPFDPLIWDRKRERAKKLFDFDYVLECYLPAVKRKYGYFLLPILHRGKLVGRMDAKVQRQKQRFEVKKIHLEPGKILEEELITALKLLLQRFSRWHGCREITILDSEPCEIKELLFPELQES